MKEIIGFKGSRIQGIKLNVQKQTLEHMNPCLPAGRLEPFVFE